MLSSAYFLAKFRFDTVENEPARKLRLFLQNFANFANFASSGLLDHRVRHVPHPAACPDSQHRHRLRQKCRLFLVCLVRNRFFCLVVRFSRAVLHRSGPIYYNIRASKSCSFIQPNVQFIIQRQSQGKRTNRKCSRLSP